MGKEDEQSFSSSGGVRPLGNLWNQNLSGFAFWILNTEHAVYAIHSEPHLNCFDLDNLSGYTGIQETNSRINELRRS